MTNIENGNLVQEIDVKVLRNPEKDYEEILLSISVDKPGTYETAVGPITIRSISILPEVAGFRLIRPGNENTSLPEGISGSHGYINLDLSGSSLGLSTDLISISLHRKGIGCQQINPHKRMWIDIGKRLGNYTGYEKDVSRWRPVER